MNYWSWTKGSTNPSRIWMAPLFASFAYLWRDALALYRHATRRDRAYVRNWTAYPTLVGGKPKWLLYYEKRRWFVYIPVVAAEVDTLDECKALMAHRYASAVKLYMHSDGTVNETPMDGDSYTLNVMFNTILEGATAMAAMSKWSKANADDVRPEGSGSRATEADREVSHGAEASAPVGPGEGERGSAAEAEAQCDSGEVQAQEVPTERS